MAEKQGTGQVFLTVRPIAYEALSRLQDKLVIPSLITRDYQQFFSNKIGDTVDVMIPYYTRSHSGRTIQDSDISKMVQRLRQVKVDTWENVAFEYNAEDLTLSLTKFGEYFLDSGCEELAHKADETCGKALGNGMFYMEGVPGTQMSFGDAQDVAAHSEWVSIPEAGRFCLMDPTDFGAIQKELQDVDSQDQIVGEAIRRRYKGTLAEYNVFRSTNIPYLVVHDYGAATPLVNLSGGYEGASLPTDGWGSTARKVLNEGQLIKIAGVKEVTRRGERKPTGNDMTFVVKSDVSCNTSGQATIPIEPELNAGTLTTTDKDGNAVSLSGFQNVSAKAADNAAITVVGTKGMSYRQSIWGIPQMATFVNVQVAPLPASERAGQVGFAYDEDTNLSLTLHSEAKVFPSLEEQLRADMYVGADAIYPDVGMRLISAAA